MFSSHEFHISIHIIISDWFESDILFGRECFFYIRGFY